jgi:hypothetical protein
MYTKSLEGHFDNAISLAMDASANVEVTAAEVSLSSFSPMICTRKEDTHV